MKETMLDYGLVVFGKRNGLEILDVVRCAKDIQNNLVPLVQLYLESIQLPKDEVMYAYAKATTPSKNYYAIYTVYVYAQDFVGRPGYFAASLVLRDQHLEETIITDILLEFGRILQPQIQAKTKHQIPPDAKIIDDIVDKLRAVIDAKKDKCHYKADYQFERGASKKIYVRPDSTEPKKHLPTFFARLYAKDYNDVAVAYTTQKPNLATEDSIDSFNIINTAKGEPPLVKSKDSTRASSIMVILWSTIAIFGLLILGYFGFEAYETYQASEKRRNDSLRRVAEQQKQHIKSVSLNMDSLKAYKVYNQDKHQRYIDFLKNKLENIGADGNIDIDDIRKLRIEYSKERRRIDNIENEYRVTQALKQDVRLYISMAEQPTSPYFGVQYNHETIDKKIEDTKRLYADSKDDNDMTALIAKLQNLKQLYYAHGYSKDNFKTKTIKLVRGKEMADIIIREFPEYKKNAEMINTLCYQVSKNYPEYTNDSSIFMTGEITVYLPKD